MSSFKTLGVIFTEQMRWAGHLIYIKVVASRWLVVMPLPYFANEGEIIGV